MNTYADKKQENKSQSVANTVAQKQSDYESMFQFMDNRSEAFAQRKLQGVITDSPREIAQRKKIASLFGPTSEGTHAHSHGREALQVRTVLVCLRAEDRKNVRCVWEE